MAAAAGSGTARTIESSLAGMAAMMALSMPLSSPVRRTLPPVARETPGWEPNTISVRPTRTWSPSFRACLPTIRMPLT
jgi:hypothetical protein